MEPLKIRNRGGMKTQSFKLQNVELRRHELHGTFEIRNRGSHGGKMQIGNFKNWNLGRHKENMNLEPWRHGKCKLETPNLSILSENLLGLKTHFTCVGHQLLLV